MNFKFRVPTGLFPSSMLGRLLAALLTASLAIVGLFFLAFALVAAALIAAVVIARLWWVARKLRTQRDASVIEGSYSVETDLTPALDDVSTKPGPTNRD
ncbi:MAG: hypothetical protein JWN94_2516 [Betaproteobacteria bacterium]|nr:hypothetical protein [Betaproteobacteria bacterium]